MDGKKRQLEIATTIKRIRQDKGISQRGLGVMIGMDSGAINRVENGSGNLKTETIFRIADALEVDPAELLGRYSQDFNALWENYARLSEEQRRRVDEQVAELAELQALRVPDE